jgi:hypothetical protein
MLVALTAGCRGKSTDVGFQARGLGRPDAAWGMEKAYRGYPAPAMTARGLRARDPLESQGLTDLNFHEAPAHEVIAFMMTKFRCKVTLTQPASSYIHGKDVRITARASRIPSNLAFEVLRGHLEAKGLVIQEAPTARTLGKPHFLIDRSTVREASIPAAR